MRPLILVMISLGIASFHTGVTARQAEPPEASVIGMVSVDVAAIWDADLFKDARGLMLTKASRFRDRIEKEIGLTPDRVTRFTCVQFKVGHGETEHLLSAWVLTSRDDIDPAKFATVTGAKRVIEKGKLVGLPDFAVYQPGFITPSALNLYIVSQRQVVLIEQRAEFYLNLQNDDAVTPAPKPMTAPKVNTEMILKSLKRDADRAAIMTKEKLALSAVFDVTETARLFGSFGDGDAEAALPPAVQSLLKARFLTASVSLATSLTASMELSFPDAETATASKTGLETSIQQLNRLLEESLPMTGVKAPSHTDLLKLAVGLLDRGTVTAKDKTVTFRTGANVSAELGTTLAKGVLAAEDAAARTTSQNNLKQLVLAAHNHADASNAPLIQNICDAKGKPLLSWRVALLPYLEQEELYKQFKLDEPWDSDHNKPQMAKMPKVFVVPSAVASKEGYTFYQTFVGKKGQAMRPLLQDGDEKGLGIASITDGTSNTLMVVEAAEAVAWTKPDDLPFDNDGKLPKLGGHFESGFNVALCDGSVRFLKATTPEANLKAMITANGGENVNFDDD